MSAPKNRAKAKLAIALNLGLGVMTEYEVKQFVDFTLSNLLVKRNPTEARCQDQLDDVPLSRSPVDLTNILY